MKRKYFAVLMSVYHGDDPELFQLSIKSLLLQNIPDDYCMRIYLAVDGPISSDLAGVITEHEPYIHKVVRSQRNLGLSCALNMLIACVQDEELCFRMDSDDISLPNRFLMQLSYMNSHQDVDVLGGQIIEHYVSEGKYKTVTFPTKNSDILSKIHLRTPVAHPTVCIRTKVLKMLNGYPLCRNNEDIALWFECINHGFTFANLDFPIVKFTIKSGFWKRRSFEKSFGELTLYLKGIYRLYGFSWKMLMPIARFLMRLSPPTISKILYNSNLRQFMVK